MTEFEERRQNILSTIEKKRKVSIEELVSQFNVNEQTIYRDLLYIEKSNKIRRTHGGAVYYPNQENLKAKVLNFNIRETEHLEQKKAISNFASTLIKDGESLMIDGGTTTLLFASSLNQKKKLMVITNTMTIGNLLKKDKKNTVLITGGQLSAISSATIGPIAEEMISNFKVNKAIIGICSINADKGFFATIEAEARVKRAMINSAKELIVLADSSKFNKEAPNLVCNFDKKITVITDKGISKTNLEKLEKMDITVYIA